MTVDTVHQIWLLGLAKNLQQGYGSPDDFHLSINNGSRAYSAYLLGNFQTYTPGRPISKVELGQNSVVRQRLAPTIYGYNLNIDVTGFAPYPGDYLQTDAMWSIYGYRRIRYAPQERMYSIYGSKIDPIGTNPIYDFIDTGFSFYPPNPYQLTQARLSYVRNPPDMIWGYDEDANGLSVYNAAKSTQPIWDDASMLEVIARAFQLIGVPLQAANVQQYAREIIDKGV